MRIPNFSTQRGVGAPQLRTPQVDPAIDLSQAIGFVEGRFEQQERQRQQDLRIFAANERSRAQLEIDRLYSEIDERVQSGGDYATAVQDFENGFRDITNRSLEFFADEPALQQETSLDYERSGLRYGSRLQQLQRERGREDAIANHNGSSEILQGEFLRAPTPEEQAEILEEFSGSVANLEAAGILSPDQARGQIGGFINSSVSLKAQMLAQEGGDEGPANALQFIEENKSSLSPEVYVEERGRYLAAQAQIETVGTAIASVEQYVASGRTTKAPTQNEIDLAYQASIAQIENPNLQVPAALDFVNTTGVVPTPFQQEATALLSTYSDAMTAADINRVADYAVAVNEMHTSPELVSSVKNLDSKFNKDVEQAAALIAAKIDNGVSQEEAVRTVMRKFTDSDYRANYNKIRRQAFLDASETRTIASSELGGGLFGIGAPEAFDGQIITEFADIAARNQAMGASESEARDLARQEVENTYDELNNVVVRMPPHLMTSYSKNSWDKIARDIQKEESIGDGANVTLAAFGGTYAERQRMLQQDGFIDQTKLPFAVLVSYGPGEVVPLMEEVEVDGQTSMRPRVVYADPKVVKEKKFVPQSIREGF